MESLVDFQKQIQFKMSVLKHIEMDTGNKQKSMSTSWIFLRYHANLSQIHSYNSEIAREISKSDGPITRRGKNEEQTEHTTKKGEKCKLTHFKVYKCSRWYNK